MKIRKVEYNNRRRVFEVHTASRQFVFPYAMLEVQPSRKNPIVKAYIDKEFDREAFTYVLKSGEEGTIHIDHVLDYNRDPRYVQEMLLYKMTLTAQKAVADCPLSKRELCRRLGTSPAQLYRLLDQTNYRKSLDQLLRLLAVLEYDVDLVVREPGDRKEALRRAV